MKLEELMQRADVWRGGRTPSAAGVSTGYAPLDEVLGGGWPRGALSEILIEHAGIGELRLLLPLLARITANQQWLAFVAPPYLPYAPALVQAGINPAHVLLIHPQSSRDVQWSLEQSLRAGTCGAVLAWLDKADWAGLRRLQLAAEAGDSLGFIYRPAAAAGQGSPAALRLRLLPAGKQNNRLALEILKCRGGWPTQAMELEVDGALAGMALP